MIHGELIVDNFAGGGGASTGIEMATGYSVDIAINHDPEAIKITKKSNRRRSAFLLISKRSSPRVIRVIS